MPTSTAGGPPRSRARRAGCRDFRGATQGKEAEIVESDLADTGVYADLERGIESLAL